MLKRLDLYGVGATVLSHFTAYIARFDHRGRWFGAGRSLLALGPLTMLLLTPIHAFIVPVGASQGTRCDGVRQFSLLCVGQPDTHLEIRRWALIAIYAVVVAGILPRVTGLLHLWAAYTLAVSITLPDGGEAIGAIAAFVILPMTLADDRLWHWQQPGSRISAAGAAASCVAAAALRAQLAYIYLDSGISKMGVTDWQNGSAEYYISRDTSFGSAGPAAPIIHFLTDHSLSLLVVTWSGIAIEVAIGALLVLPHRWRLAALALDIALHVSIIATIGLWSFGLVMMGSAVIAAGYYQTRTKSSTADPDRNQAPENQTDDRAGETITDPLPTT